MSQSVNSDIPPKPRPCLTCGLLKKKIRNPCIQTSQVVNGKVVYTTEPLCQDCTDAVFAQCNPELSQLRADEGMARAWSRAKEIWRESAIDVMLQLASEWDVFCSDDFWTKFQRQYPAVQYLAHPRAMGRVSTFLVEERIIEHPPLIYKSVREGAHRQHKQVWQISTIFRPFHNPVKYSECMQMHDLSTLCRAI